MTWQIYSDALKSREQKSCHHHKFDVLTVLYINNKRLPLLGEALWSSREAPRGVLENREMMSEIN